MEESMTPKQNLLQRSRFKRPSPSTSFKSPLLNKPEQKTAFNPESASLPDIKASALELWEKNESLKKEMAELEEKGFKEEQLKWYIDKLHEYNEVKDTAQMIFGRIAVLEQVTVRRVHEDFEMTDKD